VESRDRRRGHAAAVADRGIGEPTIEDALRHLAPRIPLHEFGAVLDHARASRGLKGASPEAAAWLSLVSYVRHTFTDYDALLKQGYDRDSARFFVAQTMQEVLAQWGVRRPLMAED
jgi:hypothetical protein